eukprot:241654-Chlamydomonas_euryale.AAC.2
MPAPHLAGYLCVCVWCGGGGVEAQAGHPAHRDQQRQSRQPLRRCLGVCVWGGVRHRLEIQPRETSKGSHDSHCA